MRVISGSCKGRPLRAVKGNNTRPTTDKVKESIFNIIGPYFDGGKVLDLYAGSGGLGIEALSRGIDSAIFVDKNPIAIETIKYNVSQCGFGEQVEIYRNDSSRALKAIIKRQLQFSLIFLDPPYAKQQLINDITMVDKNNLLDANGMVVCEHATNIELPDRFEHLVKWKTESYGTVIALTIYKL